MTRYVLMRRAACFAALTALAGAGSLIHVQADPAPPANAAPPAPPEAPATVVPSAKPSNALPPVKAASAATPAPHAATPSHANPSPHAVSPRPFLHPLFTDNMVLQRGMKDPIWGWTTPGASVSIRFRQRSKSHGGDRRQMARKDWPVQGRRSLYADRRKPAFHGF